MTLNKGASFDATARASANNALTTANTALSTANNATAKINNFSIVNVKDYGAVGDGIADDTTAIQSAITAAGINGTILFPSGNFKCVSTFTPLTGQRFFSQKGSILTGNVANFYMVAAQDDNSFEGLTFKTVDTAIFVSGKNRVNIEKCTFDTGNNPVYFNGGADGRVTKCYFNNIAVSSVIIDASARNIKIDGNTMTNPTQFGGYGAGQNSGHVYVLSGIEIEVINNHITNNGGQGIGFVYNSGLGAGAVRCKAIGNHCEGNGQEGITSFGGASKLSFDNIIQGNTCKNNRFHQIEVWQSDRCTVTGNIVEESATTYGNIGAITLYQTEHTTVGHNSVKQATSNGIAVVAGSKKCIVSNNTVKNTNTANSGSTNAGQGILLDSSGGSQPSELTIIGNVFESTNGFTASKSGVSSTANTIKFNRIANNNAFGYFTAAHEFALLTCSDFGSVAPTTGTWVQGDRVTMVYPVEAGSAGSKYVVTGWVCTVGGTPGTWLAQRMLTGN